MALLLLPTISCAYMIAAPLRASAPAGSALPSYPRPSLLPATLRQTASPSYMVSIEDLSLVVQAKQQQALEYSVAMCLAPGIVRLNPVVTTAVAALAAPLLAFRFAPRFMERVVHHVKGFANELRATGPMRMADRLLGNEPVAPLQPQSAPVPSLAEVLPARRCRSADEWATVEERVRQAAQSKSAIYMRQLQRQNGLNEKCRTQPPRGAPVQMSRREREAIW